MARRTSLDGFGIAALTGFSLLLAFNQVVVKVTNGGFGPVYAAALRSILAAVLVYGWMKLTGFRFRSTRATLPGGLTAGSLFAFEFCLLFLALDYISVARASILFYSMPLWLGLAAHFLLPGERLTGARVLGLVLAMGGVVLALADRSGEASFWGDVSVLLAAMGWAGIVLCVRVTRLSDVDPAEQLLWQLGVSGPLLLGAAFWFGEFSRGPEVLHYAGLAFQIIAVASIGFLLWFRLMAIYPASGVASFAFLSPVFAVGLGWALLGEPVSVSLELALLLVALGIWLINRKPQVPQNVAGTTSEG